MSSRLNVSVAMALYNGEGLVRQELESIARQTRLPDELVISDDASSDQGIEIVRAFARCAPFPVHIYVNEHNLGMPENFEKAIRACRGDVIVLSDWDDVYYPQKIELTEKAFAESPHSGVVICNADLVDRELQPLGRTVWQAHGFSPPHRLRQMLARGEAFMSTLTTNGCCLAFRASLKDLILPLPSDGAVPILYDGFIAWTIIFSGAGGVALIEKPLLAYRQHGSQAFGAGGNTYSHFGRLRERVSRAKERPHFGPLIARLESPAAIRLSRNQEVRTSVLQHWRARSSLPAGRLARVPVILDELVSGRYHRFSYGFAAATKDMFFVK